MHQYDLVRFVGRDRPGFDQFLYRRNAPLKVGGGFFDFHPRAFHLAFIPLYVRAFRRYDQERAFPVKNQGLPWHKL